MYIILEWISSFEQGVQVYPELKTGLETGLAALFETETEAELVARENCAWNWMVAELKPKA